tara:strand:- start:4287 stop:5303 length:1017 start_codon:yes stop_codon:yes gene_type:complete
MDDKVIIVKRKKKKPKKDKRKKKTRTKATMEQKVSQNVKVIINERSKPRRNKPLAVKGYNTPRLSIQPPTIIHKGIDAENALNSFRNIYDLRVRALEKGLNGVNGNITNLTNQLQNNRPPPLSAPVPSSNTSVMSDEEGQRILDQRLAQRLEQEQQQQYNTLKKDFYNNQEGEQDNIFENFINEPQIDPRLVRVEARLAEAEPIEPVRVEPIIIRKKKKFTKEQREEREEKKQQTKEIISMEGEERAQLKQQSRRDKSVEYTTKEIDGATDDDLYGMILTLGDEDKFFDNLGGIAKGKRTEAKNYVKNAVKENRDKRILRQEQNIRGRKLPQNLFRNL